MGRGPSDAKTRMVLATLDLLRTAGLTGAALNQIVAAGRAPKGSLYHYFPDGKDQLVTAALREAERTVGDGFRVVFGRPGTAAQKVRTLFGGAAERLSASGFTRGCPVGAVTLDLDSGAGGLRRVCGAVFDTWCDVIQAGLAEVPSAQRRRVAQLILATLEGALILARAQADRAPLVETGALLADTLEAAYASSALAGRATPARAARRAQGRRR